MDTEINVLAAEDAELSRVCSFKTRIGQNIALHASPPVKRIPMPSRFVRVQFSPVLLKHKVTCYARRLVVI